MNSQRAAGGEQRAGKNVIECIGVSVRYGRVLAADNVNLTVPRGSVYALLGRNGAGKSSLVRCLLGEQKPQAGTIRLFDQDVWRNRAALMQRVGVVSEDADAPPEMTVASIERFCASLYARWDRVAVEQRLRRFGISTGARFGSLSKGEKKQVLLAMALAMSPDLLILDDPTLGLDVVARKSLFEEVIGELADRGITVFLTTHDLAGVETIADRIAIMKKGQLVLEEEVDALKARFRRIRVASRAVSFEGAAAVRSWGAGSEAIVSDYNEVAFANLNNAEVSPMSLEEIFIAVAGEGVEA
jgi:ABC-2 type transport system ATP-binding protein